jgi:hypothetical protein
VSDLSTGKLPTSFSLTTIVLDTDPENEVLYKRDKKTGVVQLKGLSLSQMFGSGKVFPGLGAWTSSEALHIVLMVASGSGLDWRHDSVPSAEQLPGLLRLVRYN